MEKTLHETREAAVENRVNKVCNAFDFIYIPKSGYNLLSNWDPLV